MHVHVSAEGLRRAEFALAETAGIGSRRPLAAGAGVLGEGANLPRFRVVGSTTVGVAVGVGVGVGGGQALAPGVAAAGRTVRGHPRGGAHVGVVHSAPRRRTVQVLLPRKQQHARSHGRSIDRPTDHKIKASRKNNTRVRATDS